MQWLTEKVKLFFLFSFGLIFYLLDHGQIGFIRTAALSQDGKLRKRLCKLFQKIPLLTVIEGRSLPGVGEDQENPFVNGVKQDNNMRYVLVSHCSFRYRGFWSPTGRGGRSGKGVAL